MPLAERAKRGGKRIYHLNLGQPDIPTPKEFIKGFQDVPEVLSYTPSGGLNEAVLALVEYYQDQAINISGEDLIITVGGSEAVLFAIMATTDWGDEIIIPEPFYTNYNSYAEIAGVRIKPLTTHAKDGFRIPPKEKIESLIGPKTKAILITNPGNPTGTVYTKEEFEMLKEIILTYDLFLIADEVYREFVYDGLRHISVLHLEGIEENAIMVDSISKRFSACGARIGALVSRNPAVMESVIKLAQARLSPPTLGQLGLIRFLRSAEYPQAVKEMIARFERRRDLLFEELKQIPGIDFIKPQGAFYITAKLPIQDTEEFSRWLLTDFELDGETVMLAPAAGFYKTPGLGRDEVRIAYVLNRERLRKAAAILKEGIAEYTKVR
jgi:aspartate aminotransferase